MEDRESIARDLVEPAERVFCLRGFAISSTGLIVYPAAREFAWQSVWFNASGAALGRLPGTCWRDLALSADGSQVAFAASDGASDEQFVHVYNLDRNVRRRLTKRGAESHPAWSTDGKRLAYVSAGNESEDIYEAAADGDGEPRLLRRSAVLPTWSARGELVVVEVKEGPEIAVYAADQLESCRFMHCAEPQISPQGAWLAAVQANGAGIEVRPLQPGGPVIQISAPGGCQPRWSRDGRHLYYIARDRQLMAVEFSELEGSVGAPRSLFGTRLPAQNLAGFHYDVFRDGRFLINSLPEGALSLTVLMIR